ncbi:MAG: Lrp/AsnC family transcriptional regulator, partial [Xanthobacteraceae bacterium]|nr:Lrp/AsnC family transcriptional regulator [Xanthobacteraceae bacterium]
MDRFDISLLAALQNDGRLTNNELGEKVGLSASQCSRRRVALEQDGTIEGYHAALSPAALGLAVLAFVQVRLATHSPDNSRRFRELVGRTAEVQEAYALTGEADYLLKIAVPDLKALSRILNEVFLAHGSVAQVHSSVVLDRLTKSRGMPLTHLREAEPEERAGRRRNTTPRTRSEA